MGNLQNIHIGIFIVYFYDKTLSYTGSNERKQWMHFSRLCLVITEFFFIDSFTVLSEYPLGQINQRSFIETPEMATSISSFHKSSTGYDEYSLLYSTLDFFPLLVPYSEILLLGRVASNGNESINVSKLDVDNTPVTFSCIIQILYVSSNDKFGFGRLVLF